MKKLKSLLTFVLCFLPILCFSEAKKAPRKAIKKNGSTPSTHKKIEQKKVTASPKKDRILINKILARVNGGNILASDLTKPRLGSKNFTLEEAINQELFLQEGIKRKVVPTTLDVEKYIAGVRSEYENGYGKLSDEQFNKLLTDSGFSLKTYKQELNRALTVSNLLGSAIREKVFVTPAEVEKYYMENPQYTESLYLLKTCIVPFSRARREEDLNTVLDLNWIESGWMSKSQINENLRFITELQKGECARPSKTQYGFQLVKLVDIKEPELKSLQDRFIEIERELKNQKMSVFENQYANELRKRAVIEYLD